VSDGKGSRIIVCPAGSYKSGFFEDSKKKIWSKGKQVNSDYHSEINTELFTNWFINHFINYLEEGSITVMDNASYHSVILNKAPSKTQESLKLMTGSKRRI
jgi:hypothetical protein